MDRELIINSRGELFFFQMDEWNKIYYTQYNHRYISMEELSLLNDKVLTFSTTIDKKNNIHVMVLTLSGKLLYFLYENNKWSNALIANFDIKYKIYRNINILLDDENVNIIYSYANIINSNLWTIQHTLYNKKTWQNYNIISYLGEKSSPTFYIDKDIFGTIHLLYNHIHNNSFQINHTFYNPLAKLWNKSTTKLTNIETNNFLPYIFIDTKSNIHALWLEKIARNNNLKYLTLTSLGENKYKWSERNIPDILNCIDTPIIFEEKGILKIIYLIENHIGLLYSSDYGNTWFKGNLSKIDNSKTFLVKISNHSKDIKINHAYCSAENTLILHYVDSFKPILDSSPTPKFEDPFNNSIQSIPKDKNNIEEFNNGYKTQDEIKNLLMDILDSQKRLENNIDIILKKLENDKTSILSKFFTSLK